MVLALLNTDKNLILATLITCITLGLSGHTLADDDEMLVDQADSFDMEAFHKNDKSSGVFKDQPEKTKPVKMITAKGKHSVSDLFSLTPNTKGLSVSQVQHQLFTKMALICPQGWEKTSEQATKAGKQFQLEYRFNCLKK